jgi:single-stranded-DNA-specific exonuclease
MHRRWLVRRTNEEYVAYLSRAARISPPLAQILINRGLKTPQDVAAFMEPGGEASLSDPFAIQGMRAAVEAIENAARSGTRVFVHGDYDVDGLTATAILVLALQRLGIETHFFIPNRFEDGYGFNPPAVERARKAGAGLIVTVDCGISSFESVRDATAAGIAVVVTDHHEPVPAEDGRGFVLPEALAVVNPKLSAPELAHLSGAGVALKLVQALAGRFPGRLDVPQLLDLAALGTLADSVPLTGENRVIVMEGMRLIAEGARPGMAALKTVAGLDGRPLRAQLIAFVIVPRLNAAGRLGDPSPVVELLLSEEEDKGHRIATALTALNIQRQRIEEDLFREALRMLEQQPPGPAVVLAGEGWHEGVIGIVASKIAERFSRPTFILSVQNGVARGSARSIPQFDIHAGLTACRDLLISFGGHPQAAGLKLPAHSLQEFEERISAQVAAAVEDLTPELAIDASVSLRDVGFRFVQELQQLEPFGYGNPQPVLGTRDLEVLNPRVVGKNHLKLRLRQRSDVVEAIGFGMGGLMEFVDNNPRVDAAYSPVINEWAGNRSIQLTIKGLRPVTAEG